MRASAIAMLLAASCGNGTSTAPPGAAHAVLTTAVLGPGAIALQPTPETCASCGDGQYQFAPGTEVTVTAVPNADASLTTWAGACSGNGACSVKLDGDRSVIAQFTAAQAAVPSSSIGVQLAGNGQGRVHSDPAGIDCGGLCVADFPQGTQVTLTAIATGGSRFAGWEGPCSGGGTCVVTVQGGTSVTAAFVVDTATVTVGSAGPGTVVSSPGGIACGEACAAQYAKGTTVTLSALPEPNAVFDGWLGACAGMGDCVIDLSGDASVSASFSHLQQLLQVSKTGAGTGTVYSAPVGIACGPQCSFFFDQGDTVALAATPDPGSSFTGWSGDCVGIGTCLVSLSTARSVTAQFDPLPPGTAGNPPPILLAVSPNTLQSGSTGVVLTLTGQNFIDASVAFWNGQPRATAVQDANTLQMTLLDADVAAAVYGNVQVGNPAPGGGISGSVSVQVRPPAPTLTSIDPVSVPLDSAPFTMTLTGTGFTANSQVLINGSATYRTVTYVSATTLQLAVDATLLQTPQVYQIAVQNFTGFPGSASAALPFTVTSPPPAIASVFPASALAGSPDTTLTVVGSGFINPPYSYPSATSVVRWNGAALNTSFISATELRAVAPAALLAAAGSAQVTVLTPGSAGSESTPVSFTVAALAPRILSLQPASATAGSGSFTLAVRGEGFTGNASVTWNGSPRTTTFVDSTELHISVAAADVAGVGAAAVGVVDASAANSAPFGFPILSTSSAITSQTAVPIAARDLVWDSSRNRLYASVGSGGGASANSVVVIDAATGTVVTSIPAGSEPDRLALSDDASKLYVALDGATQVQRIDLARGAVDLTIELGSAAEDLQPLPGAPRSVAVARKSTMYYPGGLGLAVFDDGVQRPETTSSNFGYTDTVAFVGPDALFTYNNETSEFGLRRAQLLPSGIFLSQVTFPFNSFSIDVRADSGRLYATTGVVSDLIGHKLGTFAIGSLSSPAVAPEWLRGRVFFAGGTSLLVFHAASFVPLGTLTLNPIAAAGRFARFGGDGVAYRAAAQIVLLHSPLIGG